MFNPLAAQHVYIIQGGVPTISGRSMMLLKPTKNITEENCSKIISTSTGRFIKP